MLFEPNDQGLVLGDGKPVTLGHEATGWIAGVGADVKGFKEGDAVGFLPPADCCFECEQCVKVHNLW
jgi:propanol-preferring alcohol dehydrogenase